METISKEAKGKVENLLGTEAVKKIKELVKKADTCFFCTHIKSGESFSTRPMSTQKVDDEGYLYFLSDKGSDKNLEIQEDSYVQLLYNSSAHSGFLSIYGTAEIIYDRALIEELWEPIAKVWFTEGKDDPTISVIKVKAADGYYWDTAHGKAVSLIKMVASIVTGKTMDDSIEGNLNI